MKTHLLKISFVCGLALMVGLPLTASAADAPQTSQVRQERNYDRRTLQSRAKVQLMLENKGKRFVPVAAKAPAVTKATAKTQTGTLTIERTTKKRSDKRFEYLSKRTTSFDCRLTCRVRDRYYKGSVVTQARLVERLSNQQAIPKKRVSDILGDAEFCVSLWGKGSVPRGVVVTSHQSGQPGANPPKPGQSGGVTPPNAPGLPGSGTGSRLSINEKLRILCSVQQRLDLTKEEDRNTAREVARIYAQQRQMDAGTIERALLNPELCTNPSASMLASSSSSTGTSTDSDLTDVDGSPFASLPTLMKIVAGLIVLTFLVLLALLLLPKVQAKRPKSNGKKT